LKQTISENLNQISEKDSQLTEIISYYQKREMNLQDEMLKLTNINIQKKIKH